jgi:hypothetical protein
MKLFLCPSCSGVVYFENRSCEACGSRLGYHPPANALYALDADGDVWRPCDAPDSEYRFCANAGHDACNWLVPADSEATLCLSCRHNQVIPDLSVASNLARWRKLEFAKHHLFYCLLRLRLPLETRQEQPETGLAFEFLADDAATHVLTGHAAGTITVNVAEADDAIREQRRIEMGEPYRTLHGHFRHEIGHYYWDRLVRDEGHLPAFRGVFGDETIDYDTALKDYHANGAPADWRDNFITAYATAHPWEDFAETWAHYLHITDTLEMARYYGIHVNPVVSESTALSAEVDFDPYRASSVEQLVGHWGPIAIAVNSLNRCMGQPDLYPFVLTPPVIGKLSFIHDLVHRGDARKQPAVIRSDLRATTTGPVLNSVARDPTTSPLPSATSILQP